MTYYINNSKFIANFLTKLREVLGSNISIIQNSGYYESPDITNTTITLGEIS